MCTYNVHVSNARIKYYTEMNVNKVTIYITRYLNEVHGVVQEHLMQQPQYATWRLIFNACHFKLTRQSYYIYVQSSLSDVAR